MRLADEAQSLLLYQFRDSRKYIGLLRSLIEPLQPIANDIASFKNGLHIDEFSDHWLDVIGDMVGQVRAGLSDKEFRVWLKIRIKLNRCQGTAEEMLTIIRLLLEEDYPIALQEYSAKDVVFIFFAPITIQPEKVFALIKMASVPGLSFRFIDAAKTPFRFDVSGFSSSLFADFFKENLS